MMDSKISVKFRGSWFPGNSASRADGRPALQTGREHMVLMSRLKICTVSMRAPTSLSVEVERCKIRSMVLLLKVAFRFSGSRQLGHNQQRPAESRNGLTTVLSKFAHLRCTLVEQISQRTRGERFAALPRQTSASQLLDFGILDKLPIKCY